MGVGCGEGVSPPYWGRGLGRGPSTENFLVFDFKMLNFGVSYAINLKFFVKQKF